MFSKSTITVQSLNGDTQKIDLSDRYAFILLASENTCSKCHKNLEEIVNKTKDSKCVIPILIIRMPECFACRREFIKKYRLFKYFDSVYFDNTNVVASSFLTEDCKGGLWGKLQICRTPALILSSPEEITLYSYDKLFSDLQLLDSFQSDFAKFHEKAISVNDNK